MYGVSCVALVFACLFAFVRLRALHREFAMQFIPMTSTENAGLRAASDSSDNEGDRLQRSTADAASPRETTMPKLADIQLRTTNEAIRRRVIFPSVFPRISTLYSCPLTQTPLIRYIQPPKPLTACSCAPLGCSLPSSPASSYMACLPLVTTKATTLNAPTRPLLIATPASRRFTCSLTQSKWCRQCRGSTLANASCMRCAAHASLRVASPFSAAV